MGECIEYGAQQTKSLFKQTLVPACFHVFVHACICQGTVCLYHSIRPSVFAQATRFVCVCTCVRVRANFVFLRVSLLRTFVRMITHICTQGAPKVCAASISGENIKSAEYWVDQEIFNERAPHTDKTLVKGTQSFEALQMYLVNWACKQVCVLLSVRTSQG